MKITKQQIITNIALVVGIIVLVNILAFNYFYRLDFTADNRYTLSEATKNILQDLDQPVTINAYFSENLPPRFEKVKRDFKDLLVEYENYAGEAFLYNFINPNKGDKSERKARQKGIRPMLINTRDRNQVKQQRIYMGAEIQVGESSESLASVQASGSMEYKLTSNIKKLTIDQKPQVALIQGHGEPSKGGLDKVMQELSMLYNVEEFRLDGTREIPDKFRSAIILSPTDSFSRPAFRQLDNFLSKGNKLFIATNQVEGKLRQQQGSQEGSNLSEWLAQKSIQIKPNFLIDAKCGAVRVRQNMGGRAFNTRVKFPYFLLIKDFTDHPVTQGLETFFAPFSSEIDTANIRDNLNYEVLLSTSDKADSKTAPTRFEVQKNWRESDFQRSEVPLSLAVEGPIAGNNTSKMVVLANDNVISGQSGGQNTWEDNINFVVNAVDWLSDETGLVGLRTEGISSRPLDEVSGTRKAVYQYGNTFAPILLIVVIGLIRYRTQQHKRMKWLEGAL